MRSMFERPTFFKFTIGDRVTIKEHLHLRAIGFTLKAYEMTYPEGFMVVDLIDGIHGPDYHCEPVDQTKNARARWIEEKYLVRLDNV